MKKVFLLNALLLMLIASVGLLSGVNPQPQVVTNVNQQIVTLFGSGLYQHESVFRAAIYKGTDLIMLICVVPLMVVLSLKKFHTRDLLLLGLNAVTLYYAVSLAFGALYNDLFAAYMVFFSLNLFLFMTSLIKVLKTIKQYPSAYPKKFNMIFLMVAGSSVFVWLIEIVRTILTGHPPALLGMASTEVTYLIDLGIIAPCAFMSVYFIKKGKPIGLLSGLSLTSLNFFIGLIVISQTLMQVTYGVRVASLEILLYVLPFVVMSVVAGVLLLKNFKAFNDDHKMFAPTFKKE